MPPVAVVCNPDRPVGRKKIITPPPIKVLATKYNIAIFQPETSEEMRNGWSGNGLQAEFVAEMGQLLFAGGEEVQY